MQISRHWRMNAQRYRLEGVRYEDGDISLETRPNGQHQQETQATVKNKAEKKNKAAVTAA